MKTLGWLLSLTLGSIGVVSFNFDAGAPGKMPPGWTVALTHPGAPPHWEILKDPSAPSPPNVLAQVSGDMNEVHGPLAILNNVSVKDGELSVKIKPVAGKRDRAGGLVWRYHDPENYYLLQAESLGNHIVIFKVQDGTRTPLSPKGMPPKSYGVEHPVPVNEWSVLKVQFRGPLFSVYFNHRRLFQVVDSTFAQTGKVGLSTRADSTTYFDDFRIAGK
jgi:hypothetical protein